MIVNFINRSVTGPSMLLLLCLCSFSLSAQIIISPEASYKIKNFTSDNGLAENSITDLALDKNGFLWIATQGGLSRYDGSRFTLCTSTGNTPLPVRITRVTASRNGRVYIKIALPDDNIYFVSKTCHIDQDKELSRASHVFFGLQNEPVALDDLLRTRDKKGQDTVLERIKQITLQQEGISVNSHQLYYIFNKTQEWLDTRSGEIKKLTGWPPLASATIAGDIFIGFDSLHHCLTARNGEALKTIPATPGFRQLLTRISSGLPFKPFRHNLTGCLLQCGEEIWQIKNNSGQLDASLLFDNINSGQVNTAMLYDEKTETLFVGSFTTGLYIIKRNGFRTIIFDKTKLARNNTYSQIGIGGGLVLNSSYKYNPETGAIYQLPKALPITAFFNSSGHRLWYSTKTHVIVADTLAQTLDSLPFYNEADNNVIGSFLEDSQHRLWFAGYNSMGYIEDRKLTYIFRNSAYFEKYKINQLFSFNPHTLWIAHNNGITAYDMLTNRMDSSLQLAGCTVRNIYRARDNSIWISTYGKGFYKYDGSRFIKMPPDNNKYLFFAHSINEDNNGFFWIPTNNGLFQCQKKELEAYAAHPENTSVYYYYYKSTGKYTNEYNGGCNPASVFYKNLLLLPTLNGVVSFNPDEARPELPNQKVIVEEIRADENSLTIADTFPIAPGVKRLELAISAPYMGDAVNNILEYNLAENNNIWYPVDGSGKIVYNQLPAGVYHLSIRKRTGFGSNNYSYRRLKFTVRPFWFQTLPFLLLMTLLFAGVLFLAVRLRIRALEKSRLKLKNMVEERTAELKDTVTELHSSEKHLSHINQVQEKAIAVILHDIQSPLHYLSTYAAYFNRQLKQLSAEEINEFSKNFAESAGEINQFSNELLQWLIFNQGTQNQDTEVIDVPELLEEIKNLYVEITRLRGNRITVENEGIQPVETDRNKLKLIIRNLVDNANKNCTNGSITLWCRYDRPGENIIIAIKDTGKGMTEEKISRLLNGLSQKAPSFQKGKLGFMLVHDFIQLIHGRLEITSEEGKGTTVSIILKRGST